MVIEQFADLYVSFFVVAFPSWNSRTLHAKESSTEDATKQRLSQRD